MKLEAAFLPCRGSRGARGPAVVKSTRSRGDCSCMQQATGTCLQGLPLGPVERCRGWQVPVAGSGRQVLVTGRLDCEECRGMALIGRMAAFGHVSHHQLMHPSQLRACISTRVSSYLGMIHRVRCAQVVIVDEFTGRTMADRRWGEGLHQAVEAKEGLPIQNETITLASITYQVHLATPAPCMCPIEVQLDVKCSQQKMAEATWRAALQAVGSGVWCLGIGGQGLGSKRTMAAGSAACSAASSASASSAASACLKLDV